MSVGEILLLLAAGLISGMINSVGSGGSFFTYPALLVTGLTPIQAATTTLAGLTPGNLAAVPEYWPEVREHRDKYPREMLLVFCGCLVGIGLLLATGSDVFEDLVPWLILGATLLFAVSPRVRTWARESAPTLTDGAAGAVLVFAFSIYLTYFGSGIGNIMIALFLIRGFDDFLSANAAKNLALSMGTVMAMVAYTIAGHIQWLELVPIFVASAVGARFGSRWARRVPLPLLRGVIIAFGLFVAAWQFTR